MRRLLCQYLILFCGLVAAWQAVAQGMLTLGAGSPAVAGGHASTTPSYDVHTGPVLGRGSATSGTSTISAFGPLQTDNANDIIVAFIWNNTLSANGAARTVSSISSTSGLSWAARGSPVSYQTTNSGTAWVGLEVWWAFSAGTLAAENLTVTMSGAVDHGGYIAFGVTGANTGSPWDPNGSLPKSATANTSSIPTATGVSTTTDKTIVMQFSSSADAGGPIPDETAGTGFTLIGNVNTSAGGVSFNKGSAQYKIITTQEASITEAFGTSLNTWATIVDAIRGAP